MRIPTNLTIVQEKNGVPSVLEKGDTLASLAALYRVDPNALLQLNGLKSRLPSCDAGIEIADWILHRGRFATLPGPAGVRFAASKSDPNRCEQDERGQPLGHVGFSAGQIIQLEPGGPRRAAQSTGPTANAPRSLLPILIGLSVGAKVGGKVGAVIGGLAGWAYAGRSHA